METTGIEGVDFGVPIRYYDCDFPDRMHHFCPLQDFFSVVVRV